MLQANNLTKTFDGFTALKNATLHVKKGSIYGLVGPNGAGKSTIIRHFTGIYRPDEGEVLLEGEPIYENPAAKSKIAYIPDNLFFFLNDNLMDMMKFYRGIYPNFNMERFHLLKEAFPTIDPKRSLRHLSKGMQKQVAFWLAICCMPEMIILDEPVDGLDPIMRRQVWSLLMSDVSEHNTTVLVSSHNLRELEDVCDCVGIMDKGQIRLERSLSDLQGLTTKLQVVFENDIPVFPKDMEILHVSNIGRVYTIIIRDSQKNAIQKLRQFSPLMVDALPLSLEEIFIYELGGAEYGIKDIIL